MRKVDTDPVIIQCENCLELNASYNEICKKCGKLIKGEKDA